MDKTLRLMAILAHPDDESLGLGPTLAHYAAEGVETYLMTATRGQRGWYGYPAEYPGAEAYGQLREAELHAAAQVLRLREVCVLDYMDGDLDQAEPAEVISRIASHVQRVRPHVVVTFGPDGAYGHPDHIAISQFTTAALVQAAAAPARDGLAPHQAAKLYFLADSRALADAYREITGGQISMEVDGVARSIVTWEDWAITTRLETRAYARQAWEAFLHHRSQLPSYQRMVEKIEGQHERIFGLQNYYRAFSLVNGGRAVETDLFAGLR